VVVVESVTDAGFIEHAGGSVRLVGETLQLKFTVPVNPLPATVAVLEPVCPGVTMVTVVGFAETLKVAVPPVTVMPTPLLVEAR
jgi:hypothetical protein